MKTPDPKPQPGCVPPRVIRRYAQLTNSILRFDTDRMHWNFEKRTLHAVTEFKKRQVHTVGLDLNMIHAACVSVPERDPEPPRAA